MLNFDVKRFGFIAEKVLSLPTRKSELWQKKEIEYR